MAGWSQAKMPALAIAAALDLDCRLGLGLADSQRWRYFVSPDNNRSIT